MNNPGLDLAAPKQAEELLREMQERLQLALREAEQKMREGQAMLDKAQQIAHVGSWEWDLVTNKVRWSDEMLRIVGIKPEEFDGSLETGLGRAVHPEDRDKLRAAMERALATKVPQPIEYRVLRSDGSVGIVFADGEFVLDERGKAVRMIGTIQDITERKRIEEQLRLLNRTLEQRVAERSAAAEQRAQELARSQEALRSQTRILQESEAKFRTLAETVAAATFIFQDTKLVYVNPAAEVQTGYSKEELLSMPFWGVIDPEHRDLVRQRGLARQRGEKPLSPYEVKIRTKTGQTRWVSFTAGLIQFEGRTAVLGTAFDITTRKLAEEQLRRSEERNNAILNAIPDLMFRLTRGGKFLDFKANNPDDLYVPASQFVGRTLRDVYPAQFAESCLQQVVRTLESKQMQFFEYQLPIRGELLDYEARLVVSGEDEVLVVVRNITERKRLEKQLLEISDREQRRIGQDLHDGLCQHLTGTAFASKVLEQKLAEKSLTEAADARELAALIEQGITQARNLSRGLYPVQLETDGLPCALEQLACNSEHLFGVSCVCKLDHGIQVRDPATAAHLYRIAQEAIHNGIKHGKARRIRIGLTSSCDRITLSVTDDGVGLPATLAANKGMGLTIMKYRGQMIGAALDIRRASPGTVVSCSLQKQQDGKPKGKSHGDQETN